MKPNIYRDVCHIVIHSPEHCEAVQKRLFELGVEWRGGGTDVQFFHAEIINLNFNGEKDGISFNGSRKGTQITLDDLYAVAKPKEISVPLNASHTAVVSKDGIQVGCQKFDLSIIEALVKAKAELEGGGE